MCPDEPILSSYIDGELPSPWKERLEQHVSRCPSCSRKLSDMGRLSSLLKADQDWDGAGLSAARERIARSLDFQAWPLNHGSEAGRTRSGFLDRRVSLPLPYLAAGAAALLVALSIAVGSLAISTSANARASASQSYSARDIPIEAILQYAKQSSNQPVMIDLPSGSTFSLYGEPVVTTVEEGFPEPAAGSGMNAESAAGSR